MANNVNNGITGVIDIPGALRSRGAADGNLVGGVVAYAGDIYDVSKSKNQAAINSEVSSAIDNILSNLFSGDYDDLRNKPTLPITASSGGYVLGNTSIAYSGSFAEGYQNYAYGAYSHVEGSNNSAANGMASHAEGSGTKCNGGANHAEGYMTKSYGTASHSEGYNTTALNDYSHAEGNNTVAIAEAAHSEGIQTIAYGKASHAEGYGGNNLETSSTNVIEVSEGPGGLCQLKTSTHLQVGDILMIDWTINPNNTTLRLKVLEILEEASDYTLVKVDAPVSQMSDIPADYEAYTVLSSCKAAYGTYSHVEGYKTTASGDYSHAEGVGTETTNAAEHASGKYNQSTPNVTLFSVGIGADAEHRANAFEVDVNGNIYIQDIGDYNGTSIADVDSLQTVITDVNTRLAALTTKLNAFGRSGTRCSEQLLALGNSYAFDYTNPYGFYDHGWVPSKNVNGVAIGNKVSSIGSCSFATGIGSTGGNVTSHFYELAQAYTSGDTYIYLNEKPIGEFILAKNNPYDTPVTEDVCKIQSVQYENGKWKVELLYPYINKDIAANGYVYPVTGTHGDYSSCFGSYTVAQGKNSTVVGKYNYPSASDIFSVGIGSGMNAVSRSNAVLVTQSGDVYIKGIGNYDGGDYTSSGVKSIQTVISELQAALL